MLADNGNSLQHNWYLAFETGNVLSVAAVAIQSKVAMDLLPGIPDLKYLLYRESESSHKSKDTDTLFQLQSSSPVDLNWEASALPTSLS